MTTTRYNCGSEHSPKTPIPILPTGARPSAFLWCVLERGKPISSLDTIDTIAYRDFLWDLGRMSPETWNTVYKIPESSWLGKRNTERWSPNWRPLKN
jgi:hypothetical protein